LQHKEVNFKVVLAKNTDLQSTIQRHAFNVKTVASIV